jgi:single-strand DNA-binding protein
VNEVTLIGHVGKDPEIKYTQGGEPIANLSLATSEKWKSKDGSPQEKTQWHRLEVFGKTAQFVRDYVKKGTKLLVRGSIDYQEWEKDGVKKYATKIKVSGFKSYIEFAGPKPDGEVSGAQRATEAYVAKNTTPPTDGFTNAQGEWEANDESVPF